MLRASCKTTEIKGYLAWLSIPFHTMILPLSASRSMYPKERIGGHRKTDKKIQDTNGKALYGQMWKDQRDCCLHLDTKTKAMPLQGSPFEFVKKAGFMGISGCV